MVAYASDEDIRRWETEGRRDILAHIRSNETLWAGDRIMTVRGTYLSTCVFLNRDREGFFCTIYETRPQVCRSYEPGSSDICPQHETNR